MRIQAEMTKVPEERLNADVNITALSTSIDVGCPFSKVSVAADRHEEK